MRTIGLDSEDVSQKEVEVDEIVFFANGRTGGADTTYGSRRRMREPTWPTGSSLRRGLQRHKSANRAQERKRHKRASALRGPLLL